MLIYDNSIMTEGGPGAKGRVSWDSKAPKKNLVSFTAMH